MATNKELKTLQIRRPNKLYTTPLKKHIEILLDVLGFNFYVKNPENREFKISWVELSEKYQISTSNKNYIKANLQYLADNNYISDLKMWNYGFSYGFNDTFINWEEFKKPYEYTFLDLRIMQKLSTLGYRLYTLAYKFFDFTRKNSNNAQTRFIEIEEFLTIFNQSFNKKSGIHDVKNRLLTQIREEIKLLKRDFDIRIKMELQKFGRPIVAVKFFFPFVPKMKEIVSEFIDFKAIPKIVRDGYTNVKNKVKKVISNSQKDLDKEQKEFYTGARRFGKYDFLTQVYFPKLLKTTASTFQRTREWIIDSFGDGKEQEFQITSLVNLEKQFDYFVKHNGFYKAFQYGVLKVEDFDIYENRYGKLIARMKVQHPSMSSIKTEIPLFSVQL